MEARRADAGVSGAKRRISVRLALTSSSAGLGWVCAALFSRVLRHRSRNGALSRPSASKSLHGGGEVRFALGDAALARERRQQQLVRVAIERRELQPLIYIRCRGIVRQRAREVLEQHGLDAAEAPALGGDPGIEHRAARDLEAFEQFAGEQRGEFLLPFDA